MLLVDFSVSSALFLLFHPFASSFFSNSERILTKKCCIYFLIYACVTIQMFGAAFSCCVILDNQLVSTGFVLNMCDVKY